MRHIPELDGLRGIAVLVVVLMHAGIGCGGGYVGVDVFFVLSGFLITSLILSDLDAGTFTFGGFFERRIRRIAPALMVTLLALLIVSWFWLLPEDYARLGRATAAQIALSSNIFHWQTSGYFGVDAQRLPLLHTWSLAVEEQFYLVLPVLLFWMARLRRRLAGISLGLMWGVSFGIGVVWTSNVPEAAFYLLPSRAWELLSGSLLAATPGFGRSASAFVREVVAAVGLVCIAISVGMFDEHLPFPGVYAALPCLGTVAFIWANRAEGTLMGRLVACGFMRLAGNISYSWYLIHWPLFVLVDYWKRGELDFKTRVGMVLCSFILAIVSWLLVETPVRRGWILRGRRRVIAVFGGASLVLATTGLVIDRMQGFPVRFPPEATTPVSCPEGDSFWQLELTARDIQFGRMGLMGKVPEKDSNTAPQCVLWGDSHAMALAPVVNAMLKERGISGGLATHSATAPLLGFAIPGIAPENPTFNEMVLEDLVQKRIPLVILAGNWADYASQPGFESALQKTVSKLVEAGIEVVILLDVAYQQDEIPKLLAQAKVTGEDVERQGVTLQEHRRLNEKCELLLRRQAGKQVTLIDPAEVFSLPNGHWQVVAEGVPLYRDRHHLSIAGAMRLEPLLKPVMDRLTQP